MKIKLENSIQNVYLALKEGAHPVIILLALQLDGESRSKHRETILRWAQKKLSEEKSLFS